MSALLFRRFRVFASDVDGMYARRCKKLVNAEKQFTIDKAPLVLTIHLKRFTPTGRKVSGLIKYPETLNLKGYMSDVSFLPLLSFAPK